MTETPPPTGRVIVATNGSPSCRRAVVRAGQLFSGSEVVVVMVVRDGPAGPVADDVGAVRALSHQFEIDAATDVLVGACDALGSRARPRVLTGDPVTALCDLARAEGADAIVVGSLGLGLIGAALGGSIGAQLQRDSPCSVVELGAPI